MKSNVTVIIPCYNDEAYIKEAIASVLEQTLLPERVIIVDDGSNASTKAVLKTLNSPLIHIEHQDNKGVCTARNRGIDLAETDYILNLDADDILENGYIEKAKAVLDTDATVGVVASYYNCFNEKGVDPNTIKPLGGGVVNFLVKNNGVSCAMFRKKCWLQVGGFDVNFDKGYEDWDFWISVLSKQWEMSILKMPLFKYRIKTTSRDQDALKHHDFELRKQLFSKHKALYQQYFDTAFLELVWTNGMLKTKIGKLEQSVNYKLGALLLKPIRYIKHKLS